MNAPKTIIPIASGKGGVGKTIFAANLAIVLAKIGHSTVAVDLDLGGSNLHTALGIRNRNPGVGDFLRAQDVNLSDLLIDTGFPNLRFLPGDGRMPFMADIQKSQMMRLIPEILKIPADYIILDLGAGTAINTLVLFGLVKKGIIVTTFETPAIMNFTMFLRNFIFRILMGAIRSDKQAVKTAVEAFRQPISSEPITIQSLIETISRINPELAMKAETVIRSYRPRLIFNMGESPDDLRILDKLQTTLRHGLSIETDCFGFIPYDEAVRKSAKKKEVLLTTYPESLSSKSIVEIAGRVSDQWNVSAGTNVPKLVENMKTRFQKWKDTIVQSEVS